MPFALRLMHAIDNGHDDPLVAVEQLRKAREESDKWWAEFHPKTKIAQAAVRRLKGDEYGF